MLLSLLSFPDRHPVNDFDTYFPADWIYWNTSMSSNLTSSSPDEPHILGPDEPFPPPDPLCTYSPLLTCRFSHCPYTWLARWLGITGISDILTSSTNSASLSCTQTRFLNSQYIGLPYSPHLYPWFVSLHILPIWSRSTF